MAVANQMLTLQDFLALPEQKPALEYMNGVVSQKVAPRTRHSVLRSTILYGVRTVGRIAQEVQVLLELQVTFAGASVAPDISLYRRGRIPHDPAGEIVDDVLLPPDIAVDIVSPGQSVNALVRRCRWYISNNVEPALLVDPSDRSVVAFLANGTVQEWSGEDRIELAPVIPNIDLTVQQLFASF